MRGDQGGNCDGHPYTKELADALFGAYEYLKTKDGFIVDFVDQIDYNVLLHRKDTLITELRDFYMAIKNSKRRKVFVGPSKLSGVMNFLDIDVMVVIPEKNSFSYHFTEEAEKNTIYLFSAGMPSKGWIAQLMKQNDKITCIDCGSAFDPLFVGQTRTEQATKEEIEKFYENS
jgi:hypothetical protein